MIYINDEIYKNIRFTNRNSFKYPTYHIESLENIPFMRKNLNAIIKEMLKIANKDTFYNPQQDVLTLNHTFNVKIGYISFFCSEWMGGNKELRQFIRFYDSLKEDIDVQHPK